MKKSVLMITCAVLTQIYAAENKKFTSVMVDTTLFKITEDSIHKHDSELDLIVLGLNQQLKKITQIPSHVVGEIYVSRAPTNKMMIFSNNIVSEISVTCPILLVTEPCMTKEENYMYVTKLKDPHRDYFFSGNEALSKAGEDLAICYNKTLCKGLEILADKQNKTIGFDTLSTEVGFPRLLAAKVAFDAITHFIQGNPGYSLIHLFVKETELSFYENLIIIYLEEITGKVIWH